MCSAGHSDFFERCAACKKDFDDLNSVLAKQAQDGEVMGKRLAEAGINVTDSMMMGVTLETLIEQMFPTKRARMIFEYAVSVKMLDKMREAQKTIAKQTLIHPSNGNTTRGLHVVRK